MSGSGRKSTPVSTELASPSLLALKHMVGAMSLLHRTFKAHRTALARLIASRNLSHEDNRVIGPNGLPLIRIRHRPK